MNPSKADAGGLVARVTVRTRGCRDGELHPVLLEPGTIIHGDLAYEGVRGGWAKVVQMPLETKRPGKDKPAAEVPAPENPTRTGAAKSSRSAPRGRAKTAKTSKPRKGARGSS